MDIKRVYKTDIKKPIQHKIKLSDNSEEKIESELSKPISEIVKLVEDVFIFFV
jgi:hypothetical protein